MKLEQVLMEPQPVFKSETSKRMAEYLTAICKRMGHTRRELAAMAGVSDGYLSQLLAGNAAVPKIETLRKLAKGWGFNILEFHIAVGILTKKDIDAYTGRQSVASAPPDVMFVYDKLVAMTPSDRKAVEHAIHSVLDTYMSLRSK